MSNYTPQLLVLSGPSGVGKNTVIDELGKLGDDYRFVPTVTTRAMRPSEKPGVDYRFMQVDEFKSICAQGGLLEHAEVYGNFYGSPTDGVVDVLENGRHAILRLDIQGAKSIYRLLRTAALTVFIMPPSVDTVLERLQTRNMNSGQDLSRRWRSAAAEIVGYYVFPDRHLVYNYNRGAKVAARQIDTIVKARATSAKPSVLSALKQLCN